MEFICFWSSKIRKFSKQSTGKVQESKMFGSLTVIWSAAMMREPHLFSRRKRRGEQRHRYSRMPPNPLGASMFFGVPEQYSDQASCMTMTPQCRLPYSTTVQDQSLGSSLFFDTIFPIFCLTVMGNIWKQALCIFEGSTLTDGPVSSCNRCPRLPQMEDAEEEKMPAVFEPRALTLDGPEMSYVA